MPAHVGFVPYSTAADSHNFKPVFYDNHRHVEPSLGREAGPGAGGAGGAGRGGRARGRARRNMCATSSPARDPGRQPIASLYTRKRLSLSRGQSARPVPPYPRGSVSPSREPR